MHTSVSTRFGVCMERDTSERTGSEEIAGESNLKVFDLLNVNLSTSVN